MEALHSFGLCLFVFRVLPCLDTVRSLLLMNALCSFPAMFRLVATKRSEDSRRKATTVILDFFSVLMQLSAFVVVLVSMKARCVKRYNRTVTNSTINDTTVIIMDALVDNSAVPMAQTAEDPWTSTDYSLSDMSWEIPLALLLISSNWWENFVDKSFKFGCVEIPVKQYKDTLHRVRVKAYILASLWKVGLTFGFAFLLVPNLSMFHQAFGGLFRKAVVYNFSNGTLVPTTPPIPTQNSEGLIGTAMPISPFMVSFGDEKFLLLDSVNCSIQNSTNFTMFGHQYVNETVCEEIYVDPWRQWFTYMPMVLQVVSTGLCYYFARLACKLCMQRFSFAVPLCLATPVSVGGIIAICHLQPEKTIIIEDFLHWVCTGNGVERKWFIWHLGLGFGLWWVSQLWVTRYIWTPKAPRLAFTER